jgi:hypothetical protein
MDINNNLRVLQKYYAVVLKHNAGILPDGTSYRYMQEVVDRDVISQHDGMDTMAIISCVEYLKEKGFSDLFINGRNHIGTLYGEVPMELEICFTVDNNVVSSFRIELFIRRTKRNATFFDSDRLCGQWYWSGIAGGHLVEEVPVDMTKVIWGIKGAP